MSFKAVYGTDLHYVNVQNIIVQTFIKDDLIRIPAHSNFNEYFGDPHMGNKKSLRIETTKWCFNIPEGLVENVTISYLPENENTKLFVSIGSIDDYGYVGKLFDNIDLHLENALDYDLITTLSYSATASRLASKDIRRRINYIGFDHIFDYLLEYSYKYTEIIIHINRIKSLHELYQLKELFSELVHKPVRILLYVTVHDTSWLFLGALDPVNFFRSAKMVIINDGLKAIYIEKGFPFTGINHVVSDPPHVFYTNREPYIPLIEDRTIKIVCICEKNLIKDLKVLNVLSEQLNVPQPPVAFELLKSSNVLEATEGSNVLEAPKVSDEIQECLRSLGSTYKEFKLEIQILDTFDINMTNVIRPNLCVLMVDPGVYSSGKAQLSRSNLPIVTNTDLQNLVVDIRSGLELVISHQNVAQKFRLIVAPGPESLHIPASYIKIFSGVKPQSQENLKDTRTWLENRVYDGELYSKLHSQIKPFAIYFPQFHSVAENNYNYYSDYTDMINLRTIKMRRDSNDNKNLLTPLTDWVGYYDLLLDEHIIERQILTARAFGIKGFAIYHYWFTHNELYPRKKFVMYEVIDKIFSREHENFDFFFIWPNENWNKLTNDHKVKNIGDWTEHFEYLLPFFRHKNYLKIDNKPVFFILHYFIYLPDVLTAMTKLWTDLARRAGFAGIYLSYLLQYNSGVVEGSDAYYINAPAWKNQVMMGITSDNVVDYESYLTQWEQDIINKVPLNKDKILNIFPNFDNSARNLYGKKAVTYKNATPKNFEIYLNKLFNLYKTVKNDSKIFLINAWNEWGENMVIEPSEEFGFEYLEILRRKLLEKFGDPLPIPIMPILKETI